MEREIIIGLTEPSCSGRAYLIKNPSPEEREELLKAVEAYNATLRAEGWRGTAYLIKGEEDPKKEWSENPDHSWEGVQRWLREDGDTAEVSAGPVLELLRDPLRDDAFFPRD